jgi:hypothetical protein
MLDHILDVAGSFDLITPAWAFLQDFLSGPPADFAVPIHAGWTNRDIQQLLGRNGVKVWGLIYRGDMLMFTVCQTQAKWAYYLLSRAKVPILYAPQAAMSAAPGPRRGPTAGSSPLQRVFDFLDNLANGKF